MRLSPDAISQSSIMRLVQRVRRIELREAGENVVDLLREREAQVVREELQTAAEAAREAPQPADEP